MTELTHGVKVSSNPLLRLGLLCFIKILTSRHFPFGTNRYEPTSKFQFCEVRISLECFLIW